jgi:drug/metabolite transporter (DMT)-like permease
MHIEWAYVFAIASTTCFAGASLLFAELARKVSPLWMNAFKAALAWIFFVVTSAAFQLWVPLPGKVVYALLASGILGLAVGDIFLLTAYARIGAARTLILFGFQPFFLGVAAHFLFGQDFDWLKVLALVFFLFCLFTFSLEKFRQQGHWEWIGLLAALAGVLFDNCGLLLSRWAFEQVPDLSAIQTNIWRCGAAFVFFLIFGQVRQVGWKSGWRKLTPHWRRLAVFSVFLGTFLSLLFYLTAVKIGHLASISGVGIAGPMIASLFECIYYRKRPTGYLLVALCFYLTGIYTLTLS